MPLDCRSCGACCFSDSDCYVPVSAADLRRLGADAERLVHADAGAHYMQMRDGCCVALAVRSAAFLCTIYHRRPWICRELRAGSAACHEELALKGKLARRALRQDHTV